MKTKLFEVRDRMTFIPVLAVKMGPGDEAERYLLERSGYGHIAEDQAKYILLCRINGGSGHSSCDPYEWGGRTLTVAHQWIEENFDSASTGAVVDVEFISGETKEPKRSEREEVKTDG